MILKNLNINKFENSQFDINILLKYNKIEACYN